MSVDCVCARALPSAPSLLGLSCFSFFRFVFVLFSLVRIFVECSPHPSIIHPHLSSSHTCSSCSSSCTVLCVALSTCSSHNPNEGKGQIGSFLIEGGRAASTHRGGIPVRFLRIFSVVVGSCHPSIHPIFPLALAS